MGPAPFRVLRKSRARLPESKAKDSLVGLAFQPLKPEVRKEIERITVWFDLEKYGPKKIKIEEVSGEASAI